MAGLKEWFKQDWVDIGAKKKGGGFKKCGRKSASGSKRKISAEQNKQRGKDNDKIMS